MSEQNEPSPELDISDNAVHEVEDAIVSVDVESGEDEEDDREYEEDEDNSDESDD